MATYRESRNIEASLIDQITTSLLTDGWANIRVEKSFAEVYKGEIPCICIDVKEIRPIRKEIGSKETIKYYLVEFRIFATSDGQRLDLSDWMLNQIENGFIYYAYTITNKVVSAKVNTGRLDVFRYLTDGKELTNTENLEDIDRYRHLITCEMFVAKF